MDIFCQNEEDIEKKMLNVFACSCRYLVIIFLGYIIEWNLMTKPKICWLFTMNMNVIIHYIYMAIYVTQFQEVIGYRRQCEYYSNVTWAAWWHNICLSYSEMGHWFWYIVNGILIAWNLLGRSRGLFLIRSYHVTSRGYPIVEIRRCYDHLISQMGLPFLVRHLYIELGSKYLWAITTYSGTYCGRVHSASHISVVKL